MRAPQGNEGGRPRHPRPRRRAHPRGPRRLVDPRRVPVPAEAREAARHARHPRVQARREEGRRGALLEADRHVRTGGRDIPDAPVRRSFQDLRARRLPQRDPVRAVPARQRHHRHGGRRARLDRRVHHGRRGRDGGRGRGSPARSPFPPPQRAHRVHRHAAPPRGHRARRRGAPLPQLRASGPPGVRVHHVPGEHQREGRVRRRGQRGVRHPGHDEVHPAQDPHRGGG